MDKQQNKYISVSYQLYSLDADGTRHLEEQTQQGRPFTFISGFGFSLDGFEERLVPMEAGQEFDFTLQPEEAFGEYEEEAVHRMGREVFSINGHFDHENIFEGAIITLKDDDDRRFMARVVKVDEDSVTIDTNHPLAGETLQFTGVVLENREATNEEIQHMLNHMSHECGGCDECDCDECGDGGHEHKHECGCGHCHH